MCMYYDGAMLFAVTFDFMVRRGLNYENAKEVEYAVR